MSLLFFEQILTGNRMGLLKMFDIRSDNKGAVATMPISCKDEKKSNGVTSIAHHPTQDYIVNIHALILLYY